MTFNLLHEWVLQGKYLLPFLFASHSLRKQLFQGRVRNFPLKVGLILKGICAMWNKQEVNRLFSFEGWKHGEAPIYYNFCHGLFHLCIWTQIFATSRDHKQIVAYGRMANLLKLKQSFNRAADMMGIWWTQEMFFSYFSMEMHAMTLIGTALVRHDNHSFRWF